MNSIGTVQGWAFGRWTQVARPPAGVQPDVPATVGGGARSAFDTLADAVTRGLGVDGKGSGDRSFDGLALALRDALAAGDGSSGAVDGLLKKVSDALGTARSTLIANGLSERDADRAIAAFQSKLADAVESLSAKIQAGGAAQAPATETPTPAPAPTTDASAPAVAASASAFKASWSVDQKLGIRLVTQEGDVVRIRLRQSEGLEASAAQRGANAYASVSAYTKSRFSIDVQGSLSDTELKAISDVLGQVDRIASEFYSGDASAAFADAASLNFDPAVLAKVGLKMSQTQSLRISNVVIGPVAAPAPAPVSAPAPSPVPLPAPQPAPVEATAAPTNDVPEGTLAPTTDSAVAAEPTLTSTPVSTASTAAAPTVSPTDAVRKSVLDFIRDLLDTLGTTTQAGRITITARAKLELAVVAIDGARSPSALAEQAATGLLAGTVAKLRDA
jgi:hypothetical protein